MADLLPAHCVIELLIILGIRGKAADEVLEVVERIQVQVLVPFSHLRDLLQHIREPVLRVENRGLVHVVPEALDPLVQQDLILASEPVPGLFIQHVRKE